MEDIENTKLREKVLEFAFNIYKSRSKCIEKADRRRLTNIAEYMYDNFCQEEPVYEHVAKVLDIKVDRAKDKLLNYYLTCIDNKEKKLVLPIVRRVSAKITEPSVESIRSAKLFDKERNELKKVLKGIKELEEKKKLPQLQALKRKKLEGDDTPIEILKTKLVAQILLQINQKTNVVLQEALNKEVDHILKTLEDLPAISSVLQNITLSPLPPIGKIMISSESKEGNKVQSMNIPLDKLNESTHKKNDLSFEAKLDNTVTYVYKGHRNANGNKGGARLSTTTLNIIEERMENRALAVQNEGIQDNRKKENTSMSLSEIITTRKQPTPRIIISGPLSNCEFPKIV